jgi:uncharacterized membrane protein
MEKIIGRIFYGVAIAAIGLLTIYYRDFPYMLIPQKHPWLSDHVPLVYLSGALLFLVGVCIVFVIRLPPVSLLLGIVLLLIFCFYFIPYELASPNHMHFGEWENAAKELALAGGAFVLWRKSMPLGMVLYSLTIISFGVDHFMYGREAIGYMPSWVSHPLFWMYFCGAALLGSGIGILFKIWREWMAMLLGTMIFIWVIILHIPRVVAAPNAGEISSAFIALAYCGTAFVIAGAGATGKKTD